MRARHAEKEELNKQIENSRFTVLYAAEAAKTSLARTRAFVVYSKFSAAL